MCDRSRNQRPCHQWKNKIEDIPRNRINHYFLSMLVRGSIQAPDRAGASNRWLAGNNNGIIFRIHSSVVDGLSPETAISRAKKKKQNVKKCKNSTHKKKGKENERKKDRQTDRKKEREGLPVSLATNFPRQLHR